jgi:16S rRNA (guanine1516-N2)-methyltransferase
MLITTSYSPSAELLNETQWWGEKWGIRFVDRNQHSISKLMKLYRVSIVFTFSSKETKAHLQDGNTHSYHPSIAMIRAKQYFRGENDTLLQISQVTEGDRVLDCTAGLGTDSILYSCAVGEQGLVTAIESEFVPAFLLTAGLKRTDTEIDRMNVAMKSIEVVHDDHLSFLRQLPDRSYDIVYFDPMFRQPIHSSSAISSIRSMVNPHPIRAEAVNEAVRVANKRVVLKDSSSSPEFERLGFQKYNRKNANFTYGLIHV